MSVEIAVSSLLQVPRTQPFLFHHWLSSHKWWLIFVFILWQVMFNWPEGPGRTAATVIVFTMGYLVMLPTALCYYDRCMVKALLGQWDTKYYLFCMML